MLLFGIQRPFDGTLDKERAFALGYIEKHEQPAWVIYRMTRTEATTKAAKRSDKFRPDPEIPTGSATLADYRRSGYDADTLLLLLTWLFLGKQWPTAFSMSRFDTSALCFDCLEEERQHPDYQKAVDAELAALRSGNRNFAGLGWPSKNGRVK